MPLTPPSFSDGFAPTAANIDSVLTEFEKVNGQLDKSYIDTFSRPGKRAIRRGAHTRSARAAVNKPQKFSVGTTGTEDLLQGAYLYPAGGTVGLDLPPGRYACIINTNVDEQQLEEYRVMYNTITDSSGWSEVGTDDVTVNHPCGSFVVVVTVAEHSHVRFGIRVRDITGLNPDFTITRIAISVTAVRIYS
jgi:hypothetical protein